MALTKAQRDALPASDFAVPGKRALPIHDETHVKMAWDQVDNTKGLSDGERSSARQHILSKAKTLGMDTKGWKVSAMSWDVSLSAMSLNSPETPDHPNKAPFSGCLVRLDQPSDKPPHGSFGMKTILTSAAAEAALGSLLGMGVNYTSDLKGHDRKAKIGIIESATIESDASGKWIQIGGFLYASDFPDVTASIQAKKDDLGFSFEAERLFVSDSKVPNSLEIDKLTFTGAAILRKDSAAYSSTSIAAAAENGDYQMNKEDLDALMAAIAGIGTRLDKVEAGQAKTIEAASVIDKVSKHTAGLRKVAEGMAAAGIGGDATRGHVHILNHMADTMDASACKGVLASSYSPPSMYASGTVVGSLDAAGITAAVEAAVKPLKDEIASQATIIKDMKAAAADTSAPPERKTLPPVITTLMARGGISLPEDGKKLSIAAIDKVLAASQLPPEKRIELKIGLRNAGLLENAA
jgi:hypothetical protein